MHEMPIAVEIVNRTIDIAQQNDAVRVTEVEVEVGDMRQVVPEALELAFKVVAEGSVVEGAELRIVEEKVAAVCNACGCEFSPEIDASFVCPQCEQADARIVAGNDIILKSIVCEADEGISV